MREASILFVEGTALGGESLALPLLKDGHSIQIFHTGTKALAWAKDNQPDLIIFDASSMRSSGVRTCQRLRRALPDTPMIHCRAEAMPLDRETGADIYLARPFTPRKLMNRVRALLPADDREEQIVRYGKITLYVEKRSIEVGGQGERSLTPKLARLLEEFLRYPSSVLDRRQLMENVWKTTYIGDTRTLDVHIRWIRELIEEEPGSPQILRTIRGVGYILSLPSA